MYRHKVIYSAIYYLAFLLEIGLISIAYFATRYYFIFIPAVSVIFLVNFVFYIRQLGTRYILKTEGIYKYVNSDATLYRYSNFTSIRDTFLYLEITHRTKKKIKTLYISKLLKNYEEFETEFKQSIEQYKNDILFF